MFVDEKELLVRAGKGGDGVALFRREIYVPRGGPDGGDGGKGGDVYVLGRSNLHALTHLAPLDRIAAEDGLKGGHKTSTGRSGKESVIEVPLGTVISERTDDGWKEIGEITEEGQRILLAKGGNGGWGNWHFRSSIQQAPDRWNPGLPGEERQLRLTLKMIADVGLVGLPNAGKSTFLSVVSAAKPKIANYPFTTLEPQLGVAEIKNGREVRHVVIADLPGLIEGASQGKGLGATFLRHIERTRTILHLVDGSVTEEEILANYRTIRAEVEGWSQVLAEKSELVVLTKADTMLEDEAEAKRERLAEILGREVFLISSASHQGVASLLTKVAA